VHDDVFVASWCSKEYLRLDEENRRRALVVLATKFGVDRERVQGLLQHYSSLKPGTPLLQDLSSALNTYVHACTCTHTLIVKSRIDFTPVQVS
jgi:hypothetical protein